MASGKGNYKVCEDDFIEFEVPEASEPQITAEPMDLEIRYMRMRTF